jgi:Acyl-CoA dehydrogenases
MSTASNERGLNLRAPGRFTAAAERLVNLHGAIEPKPDPSLTEEVVNSWVRAHAYRWQAQRTATRIIEGESLNSEPSIMKVFWSELDIELHTTALRILRDRADLVTEFSNTSDETEWLTGYLFALAGPIYAGTNEIQRNIIAERVLGLPRK